MINDATVTTADVFASNGVVHIVDKVLVPPGFNDYLTYEFGGTKCPERSSTQECLNETQWRDLLEFTEASSGNMIFGLSMNTGADFAQKGPGFPSPWDPSNARQILNWTIAQKKSHL